VKFTSYFTNKVLSKRPYLRVEWVKQVMEAPVKREAQADGRIRLWGYVKEADKYLRVVLEPDGETVHNAFFDRRFKP